MNAYRPARCGTSLLLAAFSCAVYAGEGRAEEPSSEFQLKVNDKRFPVFFEDRTLTDDEERAVVADYQLLLEELVPVGRHQFLKPRVIQQGDTEIRITSALRYSAKHCKGPRGYNDVLGMVCESRDEQECLVIRKKLSDGYKAALVLKKAHEEACRALPKFVALLNNIDETSVPAVKDFFYLPGPNKEHSEELASTSKQKIVEAYRPFRYTWTSILELQMFEGRLLTIVYAANKDDGHLYDRPVIYDDGRWKIAVFIPGT